MTRKERSGLITAKGASRRPSCSPPETSAEVFRGNLSRINTAKGFVLSFCDDRRRRDAGRRPSTFPTTNHACACGQETARGAFCQTRSCEHSVTNGLRPTRWGAASRRAGNMADRRRVRRPHPTFQYHQSRSPDFLAGLGVEVRGDSSAPGFSSRWAGISAMKRERRWKGSP